MALPAHKSIDNTLIGGQEKLLVVRIGGRGRSWGRGWGLGFPPFLKKKKKESLSLMPQKKPVVEP